MESAKASAFLAESIVARGSNNSERNKRIWRIMREDSWYIGINIVVAPERIPVFRHPFL
jgi:hypothetical protein